MPMSCIMFTVTSPLRIIREALKKLQNFSNLPPMRVAWDNKSLDIMRIS